MERVEGQGTTMQGGVRTSWYKARPEKAARARLEGTRTYAGRLVGKLLTSPLPRCYHLSVKE